MVIWAEGRVSVSGPEGDELLQLSTAEIMRHWGVLREHVKDPDGRCVICRVVGVCRTRAESTALLIRAGKLMPVQFRDPAGVQVESVGQLLLAAKIALHTPAREGDPCPICGVPDCEERRLAEIGRVRPINLE